MAELQSKGRLNIKTVSELEAVSGVLVSAREREAMQEVLDRFPVRLSQHLLARLESPAIRQQFLPTTAEIVEQEGESHCFSGLLHTGVEGLERIYVDRCVIMPQPTCPSYCRFCFRKFYEHADGKAMSYAELDAALEYVHKENDLSEVLITGGEPIMDRKRLEHLLRGLRTIPHIHTIRIACRSLIMEPTLIDECLVGLFVAHQDLRRGYPIEVALHCNHESEISAETIDRIALLRERGIHVYNQTVLLQGINSDPTSMLSLLRHLRAHGVETYHLYFGGPVRGTSHLRPRLESALQLKSAIRRESTGRLNPHLIVTTRLGKVELGVDGWVVEREADSRFVWLRTPYRLDTFRRIDPAFQLPPDVRTDEEGCLVVRYLDGPVAAS